MAVLFLAHVQHKLANLVANSRPYDLHVVDLVGRQVEAKPLDHVWLWLNRQYAASGRDLAGGEQGKEPAVRADVHEDAARL